MAKRTAYQQQTFSGLARPKDVFGGSLLKSHPKTKRPLDSKWPTHLVLKANNNVLRRPGTLHRVDRQVRQSARRHGIKVYEYANVGNHLHLLIRIRKCSGWASFIRELTGRIAQLAGVGRAAGKFWKFRPYTRIVRGWRTAYRIAKDYVRLNILEAEGRIDRKEVRTLKELRATFVT